jgi:hypothetical protein
VTFLGTLSWVPASSDSSDGVSAGAIAAIAAGVIVLLAAVAVALRRRRPSTAAPGREKQAKDEAW